MSIRFRLLFAVALAACAGDATAPSPSASKDGALGQGAPAAGKDTATAISYTGTVHLGGRVLGQTRSAAAGADSLQASPVVGAVVTLYRNVFQNGEGTSVNVGTFTTRADGSYEFSNLPAGYYLLRTNIAEGPWSSSVLSYVVGNAASVTVDVRIWKN